MGPHNTICAKSNLNIFSYLLIVKVFNIKKHRVKTILPFIDKPLELTNVNMIVKIIDENSTIA